MGARSKKLKKPLGTKAEQLLEQTVFYVDRCLGRQVATELRGAGLKIEEHLDHFADDEDDDVWLPQVAKKGWVVLTKDKAMRKKPNERACIIENQVRMFTLPNGNLTGLQMIERYLSSKLRIARFLCDNEGPFIAVVQADSISSRPLEPEANQKS